jgi:cytochrome c-type biogenesis protein CcmH/NrfF
MIPLALEADDGAEADGDRQIQRGLFNRYGHRVSLKPKLPRPL